eukprot:10294418-Prorocentrum_lima.AAC.1
MKLTECFEQHCGRAGLLLAFDEGEIHRWPNGPARAQTGSPWQSRAPKSNSGTPFTTAAVSRPKPQTWSYINLTS